MSRLDYSDATHCWRGHDLNEPGTLYVDCYGRRICAVCRRTRDRDRKRRIAAAKAGEASAGTVHGENTKLVS